MAGYPTNVTSSNFYIWIIIAVTIISVIIVVILVAWEKYNFCRKTNNELEADLNQERNAARAAQN